jgi:hypothetical protein
MAQSPAFAATPYIASVSLAAVTACTTRAPTAVAGLAAAFIFQLTQASVAGLRIDQVRIKAASSAIGGATTAGTVMLWESDGVTAWPIDEFVIQPITPSPTVPSFSILSLYQTLSLPAAHSLWVSSSVTTTATTNALSVTAVGGAY